MSSWSFLISAILTPGLPSGALVVLEQVDRGELVFRQTVGRVQAVVYGLQLLGHLGVQGVVGDYPEVLALRLCGGAAGFPGLSDAGSFASVSFVSGVFGFGFILFRGVFGFFRLLGCAFLGLLVSAVRSLRGAPASVFLLSAALSERGEPAVEASGREEEEGRDEYDDEESCHDGAEQAFRPLDGKGSAAAAESASEDVVKAGEPSAVCEEQG